MKPITTTIASDHRSNFVIRHHTDLTRIDECAKCFQLSLQLQKRWLCEELSVAYPRKLQNRRMQSFLSYLSGAKYIFDVDIFRYNMRKYRFTWYRCYWSTIASKLLRPTPRLARQWWFSTMNTLLNIFKRCQAIWCGSFSLMNIVWKTATSSRQCTLRLLKKNSICHQYWVYVSLPTIASLNVSLSYCFAIIEDGFISYSSHRLD